MEVIQESIIEKAKKFVINNKGKLAALAGLAAAGGAAYYMHEKGLFGDNSGNNQNTNTFKPYEDPVKKQTIFKKDGTETIKNISDEALQQTTELMTPNKLNNLIQPS